MLYGLGEPDGTGTFSVLLSDQRGAELGLQISADHGLQNWHSLN